MHKKIFNINPTLQDAYSKISPIILNHPNKVRMISSAKQAIKATHDNEKMVSLIIKGEIELRNTHNSLVVANVFAPAILGLSSIFLETNYFYFKSVTDVELVMLPLSDFITCINYDNLWKEVSIILSYYIEIYYVRDLLISQPNVYNVIKDHLEILWHLNSNKLEHESEVSVFEFILNRTPISRSSLNKVLKDLALGGYIEIHRGKLMSLKKLPSRY